MDTLSTNLQVWFRYDPARAKVADALDSLKKEVANEQWAEQKAAADEQARRNAAYQTAMSKQATFYGDVIQKISAGLLVSTPGRFGEDVGDPSITILLKGYPAESTVAADDQIHATAFPVGLYSYTTVNNSDNTIHVWTCDTNEAVDFYLTQ
jgi:hypothetical protein